MYVRMYWRVCHYIAHVRVRVTGSSAEDSPRVLDHWSSRPSSKRVFKRSKPLRADVEPSHSLLNMQSVNDVRTDVTQR